MYLPAGAELEVHMWRLTSSDRVWYEWSAESFLCLSGEGAAKQHQRPYRWMQARPSGLTVQVWNSIPFPMRLRRPGSRACRLTQHQAESSQSSGAEAG